MAGRQLLHVVVVLSSDWDTVRRGNDFPHDIGSRVMKGLRLASADFSTSPDWCVIRRLTRMWLKRMFPNKCLSGETMAQSETVERIPDAAEQLFAEKGFENLAASDHQQGRGQPGAELSLRFEGADPAWISAFFEPK